MSGDAGLNGARHGGGFDDGMPRLFSFPSISHFPVCGVLRNASIQACFRPGLSSRTQR